MKFKLLTLLLLASITTVFAQELSFVHEIKEYSGSLSKHVFTYRTLPNGELSIITLSDKKFNMLKASHTIVTRENTVLTLPELSFKLKGMSSIEDVGNQTSKPILNCSFSDTNTIYQFSTTPGNNLTLVRLNSAQPNSFDSITSINKITDAIASVQKNFTGLTYFEIIKVQSDAKRALMYVQTEVSINNKGGNYYRYALIFDYSSRLVSAIAPEILLLHSIDECRNRSEVYLTKSLFLSAQPVIVKKEKNLDIQTAEWKVACYNADTKTLSSIHLSTKTTDPILLVSSENTFNNSSCGIYSNIVVDETNDYIYIYNLCFGAIDNKIIRLSVHKFNFDGTEIWKRSTLLEQKNVTQAHARADGIISSAQILRDGNLCIKITPNIVIHTAQHDLSSSIEDMRHTFYNFDSKSGDLVEKTDFVKHNTIISTYPDKEISDPLLLAIQNLMKQDKTLEFCDEKRPNNSVLKVNTNDYFVILKSKKVGYKIYRYKLRR